MTHKIPQKYLDRFHTKYIVALNGCWEWCAGRNQYGYGKYRYPNKGSYAHRFSYEIHSGDPGKLFVCHSCDNPCCVNPQHLWLGTQQDNMQDKLQKHRQNHPIGEINGRAVLTATDVLSIRGSLESAVNLAHRYRVTKFTIYDIRNRRSWRHI